MKKILCAILAALLLAAFAPAVLAAPAGDLAGSVAVVYTANIRGDISVLPRAAALKTAYTARGADTLLVDLGNFLQGTVYSSADGGKTLAGLMKAAGYDAVALGSHEFDFGAGKIGVEQHQVYYADDTIGKILADNGLTALSANIKTAEGGLDAFAPTAEITTASGLKVGLFGLTSPETVNNVLEANLAGLEFSSPEAAASAAVKKLAGCDIAVGLSNAGVTKVSGAVMLDVRENAGFVVGAAVIDGATGTLKSSGAVDYGSVAGDGAVRALVDAAKAKIDAEYPPASVMKSGVTLAGSQAAVRSRGTNLGDLWCDALLWFAKSGEIEKYYDEDDVANGNGKIAVPADRVVALWNGGNLRDFLNAGDMTVKDIKRVLPYPNKVAVMYLTGGQLLELLEAASQGLPYSDLTADACASFMQTAGIRYSVSEYLPYDAGEAYGAKWHKANSVNRVKIESINGNPLDKAALYAVVTSNAVYNGMDSNYVSAKKDADLSVITSAAVTDVVWMYIRGELGGKIGAKYAAHDGRITVYSSAGAAAGVTTSAPLPPTSTAPVGVNSPKTGDCALPIFAALAFAALISATRLSKRRGAK